MSCSSNDLCWWDCRVMWLADALISYAKLLRCEIVFHHGRDPEDEMPPGVCESVWLKRRWRHRACNCLVVVCKQIILYLNIYEESSILTSWHKTIVLLTYWQPGRFDFDVSCVLMLCFQDISRFALQFWCTMGDIVSLDWHHQINVILVHK